MPKYELVMRTIFEVDDEEAAKNFQEVLLSSGISQAQLGASHHGGKGPIIVYVVEFTDKTKERRVVPRATMRRFILDGGKPKF